MNKVVNNVIWTTIGVCAGASAAYVFTKKKYESILESEMQKMRDSYNRTKNELIEKNEAEKKRILDDMQEKLIQKYSTESEVSEEIDLTDEEPETLDEDPDEGIYLRQVSLSKNDPELIDAEQNGDQEDYGLVDIYYNSTDGEYYYDEEHLEPLADGEVETLFGETVTNQLSKIFEQDNIAYIRNYQRRCDYTIILQ